MQIETIKIHNFKAIRNYKGEIHGRNVYLIGGNAVGKTSFIDAVFCGLTGKNLPPQPITDNGKKGVIELDLGDFIARTKFSKGRAASFELENKNYEGEANKFIKSPRSYMEQRIGLLNFDINSFLSMSDAKQVEYVAKNLAVDFSEEDSEIEDLYESRKFDKKKLAILKEKQDFFDPKEAEKEPIDIVKISKQIEEETAKSNSVNRVKEGIKARKDEVSELQEKIFNLKREIEDGEKWLQSPENALMSDEELVELTRQRNNATEVNKGIEKAKELLAVDKEVEQLEGFIVEYNENIEKFKAQKAKKMADAINMEGLVYDVNEERFLYQGRPFDKHQTNTAAQLITGMKIASMMLKDLRILRVDASLIDNVEFDKVLDWAAKNEIELFVELVDREATQLNINVVDE